MFPSTNFSQNIPIYLLTQICVLSPLPPSLKKKKKTQKLKSKQNKKTNKTKAMLHYPPQKKIEILFYI